ncbi:GLPGLI family protein [Gilvibacter sediminis]|uniref:GLPGLI family protein n=1 Tax=Gilvibacter sediminis TaxID=379071 RepID=UPI002350823E|nr:GLPGLI family protein [Gilvibacter sediminis]MDC7998705.1 GLPGLI family protein [Gilvibacter sediminis]
MKKLLPLMLMLLSIGMNAQEFSGKAYYQSKTTVDMDWGGREMTEEMKKMIAERMRRYLEKTYILTFNGQESIYKEEEVLETDANGGSRWMGMMMGSFTPGDQYKNLETGQLVQEQEFYGKQFLIEDEIANLEWEETKESKMIGQYLAIKVTAVKKIDENDWSMARRRGGRDRDAKADDEKAKDSTATASADDDPMSQIEIPKEVIVTAWYTPMIPVKHGPGEYGGLPGLILELNVYRTTILCSKIVMNPEDTIEIKAPSKGKKVTREEYQSIVAEKMEEMREMWGRGRGGRRGGFRG